ncbi:Calcium-binding ef-hand family protein [Thalictrum thalictroides]|uniref:Calcium-binding ef-hand family protein n=1 Tax=Thalictrum thalictroides TaxID=46969 RepID=A0A7J6VCH9_THATH|nr:Calcium-binding ef-hand family protein [Thalictrum thalictroides]
MQKNREDDHEGEQQQQVLDGSEIMELVGNKQVFSNFVDHKFEELDKDKDGKLSVKELQPAVADIGSALGLPSQGTSADSDHIYSEVLSEFTHGTKDDVHKIKFKEVLSDILLGVAAGLKRDPIVILRMDGHDLFDFINSSSFEMEMVGIFTKLDLTESSLRDCISKVLEQLKVDHGMPPTSDHWVWSNFVKPALQICSTDVHKCPVSQDTFLKEFKEVAESIAQHLKEQPVIVAHSENTFDGNAIKRLLSNIFELDKSLDAAINGLPKDCHKKFSKGYLRVALDTVGPTAGLPPYGAVNQMDNVVNEVFKMVGADDGKLVEESEFKLLIKEILGSIMLQLQGNPISVSSNSVVHEPQPFSSSLLTPMSQS